MEMLRNGIRIFNATGSVIRFWDPSWPRPIEAQPDQKIEARVTHHIYPCFILNIEYVIVQFEETAEGRRTVAQALDDGADLIVGSIEAARAYDNVESLVVCEGFKHSPPAEKRMRPDRFRVF